METIFAPSKPGLVAVLDGGMGTELERRGCVIDGLPMWGTSYLPFATKGDNENTTDVIQQIHRDYLEAGADIISLATYQMSAQGCEGESKRRDLLITLKDVVSSAASMLPREVVRVQSGDENKLRSSTTTLVTGSLGPFGATLPGGQEFKGEYTRTEEEFKAFHFPRVQAFRQVMEGEGEGGEVLRIVDQQNRFLVAFETFPRLDEAMVAARCAQELGYKFYVSFTLDPNDHRKSAGGDDFATILPSLIEEGCNNDNTNNGLVGIGINCIDPFLADKWLQYVLFEAQYPTEKKSTITRNGKIALLIYPNSGELFVGGETPWIPNPKHQEVGNETTEQSSAAGIEDTLPILGKKWVGVFEEAFAQNETTPDEAAQHGLVSGEAANLFSGAFVLGGCCRSTPEVILKLAQLKKA